MFVITSLFNINVLHCLLHYYLWLFSFYNAYLFFFFKITSNSTSSIVCFFLTVRVIFIFFLFTGISVTYLSTLFCLTPPHYFARLFVVLSLVYKTRRVFPQKSLQLERKKRNIHSRWPCFLNPVRELSSFAPSFS